MCMHVITEQKARTLFNIIKSIEYLLWTIKILNGLNENSTIDH